MAPGSTSARRPEAGWRETLDALGVRPSKGRGQSFLHDIGVVERIVEAADIRAGDTVLEIGPGLGVMTRRLAERAARVVAIEIDSRLVEYLRATLPPNVEVIEGDALQVEFEDIVGSSYLVVANLPYSVGVAILRRLQESRPGPTSLTVMLQREVAERICAAPPEMSLLSVAVQFFGRPRLLFRVGGGAFVPPPNVESAVLRIERGPALLPPEAWERFFRIVAAGFGQRRKQLANGLTSGLGIDRELAREMLLGAGVDPTARAETLRIDDWLRLYAVDALQKA